MHVLARRSQTSKMRRNSTSLNSCQHDINIVIIRVNRYTGFHITQGYNRKRDFFEKRFLLLHLFSLIMFIILHLLW